MSGDTKGSADSVKTAWFWQRDAIVLLVLLGGLALCASQWRGYQIGLESKSQLESELKEASQLLRLAKKYREPFEEIRHKQAAITNARVRWTEKLERTVLQSKQRQFKFVIEDPQVIETDLSVASKTQQFAVHIEAFPSNDASLYELLESLSDHTPDLFENRGCQISRELASSALRLNCLYAIYDIQFESGHIL